MPSSVTVLHGSWTPVQKGFNWTRFVYPFHLVDTPNQLTFHWVPVKHHQQLDQTTIFWCLARRCHFYLPLLRFNCLRDEVLLFQKSHLDGRALQVSKSQGVNNHTSLKRLEKHVDNTRTAAAVCLLIDPRYKNNDKVINWFHDNWSLWLTVPM